MSPDDARIETPAQWLEHSEAWRYAHVELAPSEEFRRLAVQQHERLLHPTEAHPGAHRARVAQKGGEEGPASLKGIRPPSGTPGWK